MKSPATLEIEISDFPLPKPPASHPRYLPGPLRKSEFGLAKHTSLHILNPPAIMQESNTANDAEKHGAHATLQNVLYTRL